VNDITPPVVRIVKSEAPEKALIVITLQLDEMGTVFCYSPTTSVDTVLVSDVVAYGASTIVSAGDVDRNVQVQVTKRGTVMLSLTEELAYATYCAAKDTATNPDCTGCTVPNLSTLGEIAASRDNIGTLTTLDQSPPSFTSLGARGISETQIRVSFELNEPGTAYCRATRTDAGEPTLHVNHIIQAGFMAENWANNETLIDIDALRIGEAPLEAGTAYDVYCWAKDDAAIITCLASGATATCSAEATPNYMLQSYVETAFSSSVFPPVTAVPADGGRIDLVRTWDSTPPHLIFVKAEARDEVSITLTLQLNEPATAYCRAFNGTEPAVPTFLDVVDAPSGPFMFELPSDSPLRIYAARAYRDFEITVSGLEREVLYFIYCVADDDELVDGCSQRDVADDPNCANNQNTPMLVEAHGRYTLDLTPPVLSLDDAISTTQDSLTLTVSLDEAGTAWCAAVLDHMPAPTLNQVIAADFKTEALDAGAVNVTVTNLMKDTEYDVYCFARDDGTKSASNSSMEVLLSTKNGVAYSTLLATKMDAHVIYDSLGPALLATDPVHGYFQVASEVNLTLTFNEDVQAGMGTITFRASGHSDVEVSADSISVLNHIAQVPVAGAAALASGATWRVIVPSGVILDVEGNAFDGIPDGHYNLQT